MSIRSMDDVDLTGARVLIRQDLNVPIHDGNITSDARIRACIPTIEHAIAHGAQVMLMSHLGRPVEGQYAEEFSLLPVAKRLSFLLGRQVCLYKDYLKKTPSLTNGQVILLENVRCNVGEKSNDCALARQYARLCDVYVMDAFGSAHRAQASTHGVGLYAPKVCAGLLLVQELQALRSALRMPKRPLVAIVGGSKVSTKLTLLHRLCNMVDTLIVGGGIANTFLAAQGYKVGMSLYEPDLVGQAQDLIHQTQQKNVAIPLPRDVVVGSEFSSDAMATTKECARVCDEDMIFDIGPKTATDYVQYIEQAGTIVWNGPLGVFEFDQFAKGTKTLAHAIAKSQAFSLAGGGDTVAAVDKYAVAECISYISTGGGAFLEFLEGKSLPAIAMLEQRLGEQ